MKRTFIAAAALTLALANAASAQVRPNPNRPAGGGKRAAADQQQAPDSGRPLNRAQLERQLQQRMAQQMRQRLGLSDQQMAKVREINQRHVEKLQLVNQNERDIRISLREQMIAADSSRQGEVGTLLDKLINVQRQRLDLMAQEQKELAGVLSPLQRAQYWNMQEQVRNRLNAMNAQRQGQGGQPGPNGPPPGGPPLDGRGGGQRRPPGGVPPTP